MLLQKQKEEKYKDSFCCKKRRCCENMKLGKDVITKLDKSLQRRLQKPYPPKELASKRTYTVSIQGQKQKLKTGDILVIKKGSVISWEPIRKGISLRKRKFYYGKPIETTRPVLFIKKEDTRTIRWRRNKQGKLKEEYVEDVLVFWHGRRGSVATDRIESIQRR